MALYVNNRTAMRFWSMVTTSIDDVSQACTVREVVRAKTSLRGIDPGELEGLISRKEVVHVLVEQAKMRAQSPRIIYHVRTAPLPPGAFRRFSSNVLVSSPEYSFFEMANELPFIKLVEYGFLLCGTCTMKLEAHAFAA